MEILVVDDGSEDGTAALAREEGCRVLVHPRTSGPVVAKNTGLAAATGDYVMFMDSDDRMRKGVLPLLCRELEADPAVSAVQAKVQDFLSPDCPAGPQIRPEPYYGLFTGAVLIRRDVFDEIGPFPASLQAGEMIDWSGRMERKGLIIKKIDLISTDRRIHGSNFGRTHRDVEFKDYAALLRARIQALKDLK